MSFQFDDHTTVAEVSHGMVVTTRWWQKCPMVWWWCSFSCPSRLLLQSPFSFCRWKESFLRSPLLPRTFLWLKDKIKLTLNQDCLACIGPWVRSPTPIQTNPKPNWHPFIYSSIKIKSLCFLCTEPSLRPWESRSHNKSCMLMYL